ncbi:MAG: sulfotransferase, partial [Sphingomonadales bacterium]
MGSSFRNLRALNGLYGKADQTALFYLSALGRLPFTLIEKVVVGTRRKAVEPVYPPVFILGHWRSGTTHLYNILSKSPRFQYVNPYQAGLPGDFLLLTKLFGPLLKRSLPKGRFIDEVPVTPTSPQEDEFALANMMPYSFLHALYFPGDFFNTFNKGLFFEDVGKKEVGDWQEKLKLFYLKLQIAGPGKTILIKNPVYTARVALLREMYPEAKFIHIRRNPYKIFFSMRNFYAQLLNELSLQPHDLPDLDDHILSVYVRMMEKLERETRGLPKNQFLEIDFETLQKNPLKTIELAYDLLNLGPFGADKKYYQAYLAGIKD